MKIGSREIGNGQPCYIIAEAGTGYLASSEGGRSINALAFAMQALQAGADAVKFQLFVPDEPLFCPLDGDDRRLVRWSQTIMPLDRWAEIKRDCEEEGITFLASAFQPTAVQWLKELNVAAYKVASRAAASYPYDAVPGPFIVSNGRGWDAPAPKDRTIWLDCLMEYPTPLNVAGWDDVADWADISAIRTGLSDHSGTIWPGLDAMARGCPMLEVHFAIDKADAGNDAAVCLSVDQLKLLCEARDAFWEMRK
jgi:N-acetylneuraminate synthase